MVESMTPSVSGPSIASTPVGTTPEISTPSFSPAEFSTDTYKPISSFKEFLADTKPLNPEELRNTQRVSKSDNQTFRQSGIRSPSESFRYEVPKGLEVFESAFKNEPVGLLDPDQSFQIHQERDFQTVSQAIDELSEQIIKKDLFGEEKDAPKPAEKGIIEITPEVEELWSDLENFKYRERFDEIEFTIPDIESRTAIDYLASELIKHEAIQPKVVDELIEVTNLSQEIEQEINSKEEEKALVEVQINIKKGQEVVERLVEIDIPVEQALQVVKQSLEKKGIIIEDLDVLKPGQEIEVEEAPEVSQESHPEPNLSSSNLIGGSVFNEDSRVKPENDKLTEEEELKKRKKKELEEKHYYFIVDQRAREKRYKVIDQAIDRAFEQKEKPTGRDILANIDNSSRELRSAIKKHNDGSWEKTEEAWDFSEEIDNKDEARSKRSRIIENNRPVDIDKVPKEGVDDNEVEKVLKGDKNFYLTPESEDVTITGKAPASYYFIKKAA